MNNGELTAEVARRLTAEFKGRADILFDHGDPERDGLDKVGVIRSWFGDKRKRGTLIADLDIAVVLPDSDKVLALIEIEESSANPKTLLGNVFATLLGDHITFQCKREFQVDSQTMLIVLAQSNSEKQVITHLNQILATSVNWGTRNACIRNVLIDTFRDRFDLEKKLFRLVKSAIENRKS
jgi:hypothetical protein